MKTAVSDHEYVVLGNFVGAYKEECPITRLTVSNLGLLQCHVAVLL